MSHSAAIGAGRNPPFGGGGALSSPLIFLYRHHGSRIVGANHRKQRTSRNVGLEHPHSFLCHTPPLCPCGEKHAAPSGMKNTPDLAPQTGSENRVARNVE